MKTLRRILIAVLALILLATGGFWFYCRVINHRSFMAGFTDLVLTVQHRSDKFTRLDACEAYIAEKAESNKAPVVIEKAKFDISLREERLESLQTFIYNDQEQPAQTVFYFPGGAYINQPNAQQITMAARTAKETGCEVVLMAYPREPVYNCDTAYDLCLSYYRSYLRNNECGKIVFMGDSAGGGLALGLAEELRNRGETGPAELILISPWVDVTMSNPDMPAYVALDPMLGIDGLRRMGEVWAGGLDPADPWVSPINGDLSGLGRVTLTTGTWEILHPDCLLLAEKLEEAGTECDTIVGERMIHCYPICPIPEAKPAQEAIWAAIVRPADNVQPAPQEEEPSADPTDYSLPENWAYYALGEEKAADVFLVCPTVDMRDESNMSLDDSRTKESFLGALNMERGIYEESCRLFAPYYRQAAMKAYSMAPSEQAASLDFAYRDVSAAFAWYLEQENAGRPIVLAGFSQGADMCYRLLEEYFGDEALYERLVAVYAIGWPCTEERAQQFRQIRPAEAEDDLGVVISFDCEAPELEETFILPSGTKAHAINPLTWRTDGEPADRSENPGSCFTDYSGAIVREEAGLCGCYIDEARGILKVTDVEPADYPALVPGLPEGAYHIYDYQFFFRSLQRNVQTRVEKYGAQGVLETILERGVLRVGTAGDYQPMSYLDPETGRYVGFDAELAEDLAAELGVELEYVETSWPTLMEDTLAGKFDLAICGITVTEARQEQALMSVGYFGNGKTVLCRAEDAERYTSLEAINRPEVRVMENPGGLNEKFARENLPDATLIIHDVNQEIPGRIAAGEADVMITEIMEAGFYVGQDSRLAAPLIHEPFTRGQLGVLMPKGSDDLLERVNAFLEREMESGRIDELAKEYIYRYTDTETQEENAESDFALAS